MALLQLKPVSNSVSFSGFIEKMAWCNSIVQLHSVVLHNISDQDFNTASKKVFWGDIKCIEHTTILGVIQWTYETSRNSKRNSFLWKSKKCIYEFTVKDWISWWFLSTTLKDGQEQMMTNKTKYDSHGF